MTGYSLTGNATTNSKTTNNSMTMTSSNSAQLNSTSNIENNTTGTKVKYPNPSLSRSRSILLKENSKSPPCITVGLRPHLEVFEGSNPLDLKVIYLGEPMPTISWKKDNIPLSTETIKSKPNCSILCLPSVNAESDNGLYSCTVENSEGKVETRCQLSIVSKNNMSKLVQNPVAAPAVPLEEATTGNSDQNRRSTKVEAADSLGSSPGTGNVPNTGTGSTLIKPSPPIVLEHLKCVRAEDGGEAELSCKIVCPPCSFDVVWIHNGKEIKPSKDFQYHHVDSRYSLKIPELFPEDSGVYTCEAFNDYGETFTTCSLYVSCPGKQSNISDSSAATAFKTFPKSISVARGGPVVVQAELHPGCDRQVTWIKDGCVIDQTFINEQNKVQFSIVQAGVRDTGIYELHVTTKNENVNGNDINGNGNEINGSVNGDNDEARSKEPSSTTVAPSSVVMVAAFAIIVL